MVKFFGPAPFFYFTILLAFFTVFYAPKKCVALRVLCLAPYNQHIKSHFALAQTMSKVLAAQPFIKYLKIFAPVTHKSPLPAMEISEKLEIETFEIGYDELRVLGNYPSDLESTEDGFEMPPPKNHHNHVQPISWPTVSIPLMNKFRFQMEMLLPEALAKHKMRIEKLRNEQYDIGMVEFFFLGNLAIFPLLGIKNVVLHMAVPMFTPFFDLAGVIEQMKRLGVPERKAARVEGEHSYKKSAEEIAHDFDVMTQIHRSELSKADKEFAQIYKDVYGQNEYIGIGKLFKETKYKFINWQPSIDFDAIKEVDKQIPNLKFIGGIAVPKKFPAENEETKAWFADPRFDSVVLLSFGSVFKTELMPKSMFDKFIEAFRQFPKTLFIAKMNPNFGENELPPPENVAFTNWMQQPLILAHPKTKVFITPCGSNSVVDAVAVGIPLLCIPVTTDQPYNSLVLAEKGMAMTMRIEEIAESKNVEANPLAIALGKMMDWKDGNADFKAKVAAVKKEMSSGEATFLNSMRQLAKKIGNESRRPMPQRKMKRKRRRLLPQKRELVKA